MQPRVVGLPEAELDRIDAGLRRGFAHGELARKVLLQLSRRPHAVIAKTDAERRCLLSDLKRAEAGLGDVRNPLVDPRILRSR